ncbi:MAG: ATP-binding protein [Chitinophagaceae bacterium]
MNPKLQQLLDSIQQSAHLSDDEKKVLERSVRESDKEMEILAFKLDRTEKVKRTTAILLEETIEELEQKRKAVEAQNRELEIESSLERVRAVAMGMMRAGDLLNICQAQFQELKQLGFTEIRNTMISIFYDDKKYLLDYDFSDFASGNITEIPYGQNAQVDSHIKQMKSAKDAFTEFVVEGKALEDWKEFRRKNGEYEDTRLESILSVYYYFYSVDSGSIGISTFKKISQDQLAILKRFRNVFDLAYKRYIDIAKAEAQAKDAQIELSLERVRARSMAMHKSEELVDTSVVLFQELKTLGIEALRTGVGIVDEAAETVEIWSSQLIEQRANKILGLVPLKKHPFWEGYFKAWKEKKLFFTFSLTGDEVRKYYEAMSSIISYSDQGKFNPGETFHTFFFTEGSLNVVTKQSLSESECDLLVRFARVFGQIYRRFLDLQQAEAQARESQIELGLERVRARAMAMQHSVELSELVNTVFKELTKLDFALTWCIINIIDESSMSNTVWAANPDIDKAPESYYMRFEDYPYHHAMLKGWKERKTKYVYVLEGREKQVYDDYLFRETEFKRTPEAAQAASKVLKKYVCSFSFSNFGGLQTVGEEPLSEASMDILARFGKVFDLTYTRFNDLQKAEAQAREAQIEAALERVRSRTMAMQKSTELGETATSLFEQMNTLVPDLWTCGFVLCDKNKPVDEWWLSGGNGYMPDLILPNTGDLTHENIYKGWLQGSSYHEEVVEGEELQKHYEWLMTIPVAKAAFDAQATAGIPKPVWQQLSCAYFTHGYLVVITKMPCHEAEVFKRFAKVFDQTYTRFLDLQKAEEQAREAKIEAALERVRSRTMAMHKTDQLLDAAELVYKELTILGITSMAISYAFVNEQEKNALYYGINPVDGKIPPIPFVFPHTGTGVMRTILSSWKKQEAFAMIELDEKATLEHQTWVGEQIQITFAKHNIPFSIEDFLSVSPQTAAIYNFNFTQGYLFIIGQERLAAQQEEMVVRFAKVFEMTYRRFLDLQNAEAQAREAQIETALERVRSRTMGMQKSEELKEVIQVVYDQFVHLNIRVEHTGFVMDYKARDDYHIWIADHIGAPSQVTIPYFDCVYYNCFNEAKEKGSDFFATNLAFEEKNNFYQQLFKHVPGLPEESKEFLLSCPGLAASTVLLENIGLYIENFSGTPYSDEENAILMRFGKVFQQTYRRFLDLQKAEEQAREAKIEAALERTRTQSMIMQHSKELDDTLRVFHEQVQSLGINSAFSFLWLPDEKKEEHIFWAAWKETGSTSTGPKSKAINYPLDRNEPATAQCLVDWKSDEPIHSYAVPPAEVENYFAAWSALFEGAEKLKPGNFPGGLHYVEAFMKYGCFGVMVETDLSNDEKKILGRFATEFERTYTRFLDLKKAEAQAREAMIEAALERLRAKAMAMHHSDELDEVLAVLCDQFDVLGILPMSTHMTVFDMENNKFTFRETGKFGNRSFGEQTVDVDAMDIWKEATDQWRARKPFSINRLHFPKESLPQVWQVFHQSFASMPEDSRITPDDYPDGIYHTAGKHPFGYIGMNQVRKATEEEEQIVLKFSTEFGRVYQRFLDLKNAEAQAREAKIESALEKVRSRTMAMQKSEELSATATVLFEQLSGLGEAPERTFIGVFNEAEQVIEIWATLHGGFQMDRSVKISLDEPVVINPSYKAWKAQKKSICIDLQGQDLEDYFQHLRDLGAPVSREIFGTRRLENIAFFSKGVLGIITPGPRPREAIELYERFAAVFDGTYTRFLDLQRSEAQAREAQIQLALERVRARTMAMQKSDELAETAYVLLQQFEQLGEDPEQLGIGIFNEKEGVLELWTTINGKIREEVVTVSLDEPVVMRRFYAGWKEEKKTLVIDISGKELEQYNKYRDSLTPVKMEPGRIKERRVISIAYFSKGALSLATSEPRPRETLQLLERFAAVFDGTYTRFLDLQRSEAQAREAQIETALEKVRSCSLAMHKSDELHQVINVVTEQFTQLGFRFDTANFIINYTSSGGDWWISTPGLKIPANIYFPAADIFIFRNLAEMTKAGNEFFTESLSFAEKNEFFDYAFANTKLKDVIPEQRKEYIYSSPGVSSSSVVSKNVILSIANYQLLPYTEEENAIIRRISKVFEQSYTRFLDLQRSEAQTREAQIEVALERVRSKAMAMHKSEDLQAAVAVVFEELDKLDLGVLRVGISVLNKESRTGNIWVTSKDGEKPVQVSGDESFDIHPLLQGAFEAWLRQEDFYYVLKGKDLVQYYKAVETAQFKLPQSQMIQAANDQVQYCNVSVYNSGGLFAFRDTDFPEEAKIVMKRFAGVFDLTYKRYLDLQKAEAQAREALIEAALERVRSKTMAMHNSKDVGDTVATMFDELVKLNIETVRCGIAIIHDITQMEVWTASSKEDGDVGLIIGQLDMRSHPLFMGVYNAWKKKEQIISYELVGEDLKNYFRAVNNSPHYPIRYDIASLPDKQSNTAFIFPEGSLFVFSQEPLTSEASQVFKRFAGVFGQTYRRYLDLKKAEAQAREAQIEASLERVRGKAMSMHSSQDLSATVDIFFKELKILGIIPLRCGVGELDETERTSTMSATTAQQQGESYEMIGKLKLSGHPVLDNIFEHWKSQTDYFPVLTGPDIKKYYQVMKPQVDFPDYPDSTAQYGNYFSFKEGIVFAWTEKELTEEELRIFRKFTAVVSLTYRRYIELQKSETNARETVKQAALDRVRAEIASMRTIADLERITPVIWQELTILGIPFMRCGVFIMDEEQQLIHTFLSTPDGKAIGAFHLPYTTPGNIQQVVSNWHKNKNYIDHWKEDQFTAFADILMKQGTITAPDQYLSGIPQGGFYLHFFPFLQGMLYVGNKVQLGEAEIKLIQSVADAFSTAYARYEDFNKLEAAKQQVDKTLVDLKQTQQQLVQSEKMASLGELTAGIAHEIQNPLNFVNNFSEVSNELIDEMMEEVAKGNYAEVKAIADDVKQNLEKINHHGKRADGIVKGMLQHSRSSSASKEPTDINKLADEYLRLAYHGLRAKDKTFNATMKTDYDESIGSIGVIPQDIGRVVLNLITNAFYVVNEKKTQQSNGYEPTVTVSTKKEGDRVLVSVKDNGNGIPQKVLDKIFQPFFTTKPTGQGTGLGLSLSYDIVKAHGGELKVETKEGVGSEFIIQLPTS